MQPPITPGTRVAAVLAAYPQSYAILRRRGCPEMRRIMSVRAAARIHRIPLAKLLDGLDRAAPGSPRQREPAANGRDGTHVRRSRDEQRGSCAGVAQSKQ